MIIIGRQSGSTAGLKLSQSSCLVGLRSLSLGIPFFFENLLTIIIIATQSIIAGPIPATNSLPIDVPVIDPYIIAAIPGGISGVIIDEAAVIALANPLE